MIMDINAGNPFISVIVPTINRVSQIDALLKSILECKYNKCEIIIVDQNVDNKLAEIIALYSDILPIRQYRVSFVGASRARNFGSSFANGEFLFFPDDDCELFPDTFKKIEEIILNRKSDVVFGKCIDRDGCDAVGRFSRHSGYLSKNKYKEMFIEATMVIRRSLFLDHMFDEGLGVGTFYGSEEAYDLVLRLLDNNAIMYYEKEFVIFHPRKVANHSSKDEIRRVFFYSSGFGKLCKKHELNYEYWRRMILVIIYIPYCLLLKRSKFNYYVSELAGLIAGRVA